MEPDEDDPPDLHGRVIAEAAAKVGAAPTRDPETLVVVSKVSPAKRCPAHDMTMHQKPTRYGARWVCPFLGCDFVCWDGETSTPADTATRGLRKRCHAVLDPLWKAAAAPGGQRRSQTTRRRKREELYARIGEWLALPREKCHIGMFDRVQCLTLLFRLGLTDLPDPVVLPFVLAVAAAPADALPRLAFADFLEEGAKPARCPAGCHKGRVPDDLVKARRVEKLSDFDPATRTWACDQCEGTGEIPAGQVEVAHCLREPTKEGLLFRPDPGDLVKIVWPSYRPVEVGVLPKELFRPAVGEDGEETGFLEYRPDLLLTANRPAG